MKKVFLLISIALVALAGCNQQEPPILRVASYNLRMDTQGDSLNAWTYRKDNVNALIRFHDFDMFGTQEGFHHQLQDVLRMPEYAYIGAGRDDGQTAGEHSAIFYKKDRFEVLEQGNFWLRETPDVPGKGWDATCCNRICSWGQFKDKQSGKTFYYFNVHFDHQGVVARQESGKLMVAKIKEIAKDAPVICTGDFNSLPDTEQIRLLSEYLNDSRAVTQAPPYGPEGTFNRRFANPVGAGRIDYIFVSDGFDVLRYASLTDNNGQFYPSDHIPVMAEIILK
ncbi:MAG: endonuclease/exonuclease/phosphatase family protein [Tannerella sp.]|jgi:endonuclease/exonuclease/phosphatase family metal-dependent hydrolase|nr:endonuclease/exonuclease/phosphatase family protein [Tannerella sp.]